MNFKKNYLKTDNQPNFHVPNAILKQINKKETKQKNANSFLLTATFILVYWTVAKMYATNLPSLNICKRLMHTRTEHVQLLYYRASLYIAIMPLSHSICMEILLLYMYMHSPMEHATIIFFQIQYKSDWKTNKQRKLWIKSNAYTKWNCNKPCA